MNDSIGVPIELGDWVAFYKTAKGKTFLGQVVSFNTNTMVILPKDKKATVTKTPIQIVKVPVEAGEPKRIIVFDAIGNEINIGDWVAMTNSSNGYSNYSNYSSTFNGKVVFGEISKLSKTTVEVQIRAKNSRLLKKSPKQLVKVSEEQMTLRCFSL